LLRKESEADYELGLKEMHNDGIDSQLAILFGEAEDTAGNKDMVVVLRGGKLAQR
jgi:hypothetical protein